MSSCSRLPKMLSLKDVAALLLPGTLLFAGLYLYRNPSPQLTARSVDLPLAVPDLTLTGKNHCSDRECTQYLTKRDRSQLKECELKLRELDVQPFRGSNCRFRNGTGKMAVALVSFPGSGNTWVRSLLERITGVCTGSNVCDVSLRASGFIGEFADSSSLLVVKTHQPYPRWARDTRHYEEEMFNKAVVLVRNPFHALVAEWHRRVANGLMASTVNVHSHVARAGPEWFGHNPLWEKYLKVKSTLWRLVIKHWVLESDPERVLLVHYEDLVNDTYHELVRMLDFISQPYNRHNVQKSLGSDSDLFHRQHTSAFEHFTEEQYKSISEMLSDTMSAVGRSNYRGKLKLQQYKHTHL